MEFKFVQSSDFHPYSGCEREYSRLRTRIQVPTTTRDGQEVEELLQLDLEKNKW
jgi:hypothetical protein